MQHSVSTLAFLDKRLHNSLVGRLKGKLGISTKDYYEAKTKTAEDRRTHNKAQIHGYYTSLQKELDAALFGLPGHDEFVVGVDTVFDVDKKGYIKLFKSYSFVLHPPAVSSNGKVVAKKKQKMMAIIGSTAKEALESMATECAREFGLKMRYYSSKDLVPPELQRYIDKENGMVIVDTFYPLIVERKGIPQIAFRSQKDMRKAIMNALEPDFALIDESWKCSFTEMNKIQRSVTTLADWGVSRLEKTKVLDRKLARARRDFRQAISKLHSADGTAREKLESIYSKFNEIDSQYKSAKKDWQRALSLRATRTKEYLEKQSDCIRRIELCGQRFELEILPELEALLKTDPRISKLTKTKEALTRLAVMIDWGQRLAFILGFIAR